MSSRFPILFNLIHVLFPYINIPIEKLIMQTRPRLFIRNTLSAILLNDPFLRLFLDEILWKINERVFFHHFFKMDHFIGDKFWTISASRIFVIRIVYIQKSSWAWLFIFWCIHTIHAFSGIRHIHERAFFAFPVTVFFILLQNGFWKRRHLY